MEQEVSCHCRIGISVIDNGTNKPQWPKESGLPQRQTTTPIEN